MRQTWSPIPERSQCVSVIPGSAQNEARGVEVRLLIGESFIPGVTPSFSSVNSQICKFGIVIWLTDDSRILLEYSELELRHTPLLVPGHCMSKETSVLQNTQLGSRHTSLWPRYRTSQECVCLKNPNPQQSFKILLEGPVHNAQPTYLFGNPKHHVKIRIHKYYSQDQIILIICE